MIPNNVNFERASRFFFRNIFIGLFLTFISLSGCEEESSFIGLEIQPPSDRLLVKFTRQNVVNAYTFLIDSLVSSNYSIQLLGEINDPVFGISKADFFSKMVLGTYGYNFGENPVADSMFLYLRLGGYYGERSSEQIINVYELTDTIYYDSTYYSNLDPTAFFEPSSLITSYLYTPGTNDSLIKIPITDNAFITRFIQMDSATKATENNFQKFFPGVYITSEKQNDPGTILSVSLISNNSRMVLHYHNDSDTLQLNCFFGNFVPKVNLFRHNYSGTEFFTNLNQTVIQDSVVYIQSMSGLAARLQFPDLTGWRDSIPVAINKARLILPVELSDLTASTFEKPARLILLTKDESGKFQTISDYDLGSAYFGGSYSLDTKSYHFNITNQLQKFINGSIQELDLYLLVNDIATTANRVVIKSGNHSSPIRLEITYHKY